MQDTLEKKLRAMDAENLELRLRLEQQEKNATNYESEFESRELQRIQVKLREERIEHERQIIVLNERHEEQMKIQAVNF